MLVTWWQTTDVCTPQGDHWTSTATGHPKVTLSSESLQVRDKWETEPTPQHGMNLLLNSHKAHTEQNDNKKWLGMIYTAMWGWRRWNERESKNEGCILQTILLCNLCTHMRTTCTLDVFPNNLMRYFILCRTSTMAVCTYHRISPTPKLELQLNLTSVGKHFTQYLYKGP